MLIYSYLYGRGARITSFIHEWENKIKYDKFKHRRNKSIIHNFCLLEKIKNNENVIGQRERKQAI